MRFTISVFLVVCAICCSSESAYAKEMKVGGYTLSSVNVAETKTDNQYIIDLKFTCRVKDGPSCPLLKLSVYLVNKKGDTATLTAFAKDVGGSNSRIAEGVGKGFFSTPGESWRIDSIYPYCQD